MATRHHEDGGGSALNTACALACAGRRVLAIGRVGDDPDGRASIAALERRGVEVRIEIVPGRTTKHNDLYVERSTRATAFRAFVPRNCVLPWEEDPPGTMEASILLLDRLAASACGWLRTRRAMPGLVNAFNRNAPPFRGPAEKRYREALSLLDYLQIPEGDGAPHGEPARQMAAPEERQAVHSPAAAPPLTDAEVAHILSAGVRILLRTRGPRGVVLHADGQDPITIPAEPTDVLDPTGAGDALTAGLLDGLLAGSPTVDAARRGIHWAARACRHLGARAWLDEEPPGV